MFKKPILIQLFLLAACCVLQAQTTTLRCGQGLEAPITDPSTLERVEAIEAHTQQWIANQNQQVAVREIITIPVVVHVVYHEDIENIPDEQIYGQIAVLNEDFRFLSTDIESLPTAFQPLAADMEIEFCLVQIDPLGEATTGITRTYTDYECIGNTLATLTPGAKPRLFYSDEGGVDIWDTEKYLNIYVANACGRFLGRTKQPGTVSPNEDAPVIDYDHFGSNCSPSAKPYHLGRTATHEIGHFFNLLHVFGDNKGCVIDDLVADTPLQDSAYVGCPSGRPVSCGSQDQFMNFMDFVDDRCMMMFTLGQKARVLASLSPGGPRSSLANGSNLCASAPLPPSQDALTVFPNPVSHCIQLDLSTSYEGKVQVRLFNALGKLVYDQTDNHFALKRIDTAQLADGVYWLVLTYGDELVSKKVMRVR